MNVVSVYLRKNGVDLPRAEEVIEIAFQFVKNREYQVSPQAVLHFVNNSACSSYDCEFICLADTLNTKLVTYDKQILKEFPQIAIRPEDYLSPKK